MKYFLAFFVVVVGFFSGNVALAQIEITEIMYDLEGGDAGLEWVEVHNTGSNPVDLSSWRFFEADTAHKLSIVYGDGVLSGGEYGVIVSDVPPISIGEIFDSTFSLSNIGETIGIKDSDLNEVFMVTYTSDWGASGDGNSLQKIGSVWKVGVPTPGKANTAVVVVADPSPEQNAGAPVSHEDEENIVSSKSISPEIQLDHRMNVSLSPRDVTGIAGTRVVLNGRATNEYGYDMLTARYYWNFGDGTQGEGKRVEHVYQYPGVYMVTLNVSAGGYSASDRAKVTVVPADISISNVGTEDMFIELYNQTEHELELSGWQLKAGESGFVFPVGTYMFPGKTIILAQRVTGLTTADEVLLTYPDGTVVYTYRIEDNDIEQKEEVIQSLVVPVNQEIRNFYETPVVVKSEAAGTVPSASLIQKDSEELVPIPEENQESKEINEYNDILDGNVAQLAATSKIGNNNDNGLFWGIMGVALLVLIAIYAILDRKPESDGMGIKSEADLYKIIEIDD